MNCFCVGPQNGQPLCPCRMNNVEIKNGRYVEIIDHGPEVPQIHIEKLYKYYTDAIQIQISEGEINMKGLWNSTFPEPDMQDRIEALEDEVKRLKKKLKKSQKNEETEIDGPQLLND